jgi:hypothetical protein
MRSVRYVLGVGGLVAAIAGACAEGTETTPSSGGNGGQGDEGGGGDGGGGGELCAIDCTAIVAGPCNHTVCNDGQYLGPIGGCVVIPDADGGPCDDGEFCTAGDSCIGGQCTPGPTNHCGMEPDECKQIVCNEQARACMQTPAPNGQFCTPTDPCLVNATCQSGSCSGGSQKDCFFAPVPNECYVAVCNPSSGMCEPEIGPGGNPCVDQSDLCTVQKTCDQGNCVGGVPKDCSSFSQGCNVGTCDVATGNCFGMPVNEGDPCDDHDHCTVGEICTMSACVGGTPIVACVSGDQCCPPGCDDPADMDCAPPLPCTSGSYGTDPGSDPWVVCFADQNAAWLSSAAFGTYHINDICQYLGYNFASQWGENCGSVCGYCEGFTSCQNPGTQFYDGFVGCFPPQTLCSEGMWQCSM